MALGWADLSDLSWSLDQRVEALALKGARRSLFQAGVRCLGRNGLRMVCGEVVLTSGSREDDGSQRGGQAVTHRVGAVCPTEQKKAAPSLREKSQLSSGTSTLGLAAK